MRSVALFLGMLLTTLGVGCGADVDNQLEAVPSSSASVPTSNSSHELTTPNTQPSHQGIGQDPTVEDHNGKRCTFNCPECWQAARVTWGNCAETASNLGCWNARWCRPGVCC